MNILLLIVLVIMFAMALVGLLLCIFTKSASDWNAVGLGLLFGAAVGFFATGITYM